MKDCRFGQTPYGQTEVGFLWFVCLNEQCIARRAPCEMRDDCTDISLDGTYISCGDWYVQASQQTGILRNPYRMLVDGSLSQVSAAG
jgi:hypothetical protein